MNVVLRSLAVWAAKRPLVWVAAVLLLLGGCDSCLSRETSRIELYSPDAPETVVRTQTPVTPVGVPAQTPGAPSQTQTPASPEGQPEGVSLSELQLSMATVRELEIGMPYDKVHEILGSPGVLIAGTVAANSVYRWPLVGINLMGRFEDGVLSRTSIVYTSGDVPEQRDVSAIQFNQHLYDSITLGMAYEEVQGLIGVDPQVLTPGAETVAIYQWSDRRGSSIIGRFDNNVLDRKSGNIRGPELEEQEEAPSQEAVAPQVSYRYPITEEAPEEETPVETVPSPVEHEAAQQEAEVTEQPQRRVLVAGASRREREQADDPSPHVGRSYRPAARFPDFSRRLRRGDFEIRIRNRANVGMEAAIISSEGGRQVSIASGSDASIFVGRGTYEVYYIYADDPFTLYQGQRIPVDQTLSDFVVDIYDDSYNVGFLDRNIEPSGGSRR